MISRRLIFSILQVLFITKELTAYPYTSCAESLVTSPYLLEETLIASGGTLIVATGSPIPPTGISVLSENSFEGMVSVEGRLPFLGTVEFEGALPTIGTGAVSYGCGNGNVGMVSEEIAPAGFAGRAMGSRAFGCNAF